MVSEKKVRCFELDSDDIRVKKLLSKEFLMIEVWGISNEYPNRNGSTFTDESMEKALPTFKNKPCLGAFDTWTRDFKGHEGDVKVDKDLDMAYWDNNGGEIPLGVIRDQDPVSIKEKNGLKWIVFDCALWVQYGYVQIKKILKSKTKKVSVEIIVNQSHFDEDGVEIIDDFTFNGFTILGEQIEEGIAGAHLSILDKLEDSVFTKKVAILQFAYQELEKKEGTFVMGDDKKISIDNNKEAAVESSRWGNPGAKLYKPILEASNKTALINEAYLIAEEGYEDAPSEKLKYPHHQIKGDKLVLNVQGVQAAFQRASQEGIVSGEIKKHLLRHYHELGLNTDNFEQEKDQKFEDGEAKEAKRMELTDNQKREILNQELQKKIKNDSEENKHYGWVCDFDSQYIYYNLDDVQYRAPYMMQDGDEEQGIFATINIEEAVRVISSWKEYSATEGENRESKLTENPEDVISHKPEERFNTDTSEEKVDENIDSDKKKMSEDIQEENVDKDIDKDKGTMEKEALDSDKAEENVDKSIDSDKKDMSETDDVEEDVDEDEDEDKEDMEHIDDTVCMADYLSLKTDYEKVCEELASYKQKELEAERTVWSEEAKKMVDEEEEIPSDKKEEIKETLEAKCMCGDFETHDDMCMYTEDVLAKTTYQLRKTHKAEKETKEFSAPITVKVNSSVKEEEDFEEESFNKLQKYVKK